MPERLTIDQIDQSRPVAEWKSLVADRGKRRHMSYTSDFDTRAYVFDEPGEGWDEEPRRLHLENRERVRAGLAREFGEYCLDAKIADFVAIGSKPFSVVRYHNSFFDQVRRSFVVGSYYPALLGACALGERILNHLILDLRDDFRHTPEHKAVAGKGSFADWSRAIGTLEAWGVLLPRAIEEFRALMSLRHRSVHFNASTYAILRDDALAAVLHVREIIDQQFTAFGLRPWFIDGTRGLIFIKKEWEENPFIRAFYLPSCPFVGPNVAISFKNGLSFYDTLDYGDGQWSDVEFAEAYETRSPKDVARTPEDEEADRLEAGDRTP
ncbi:hypothetical protein SAMN05192583_3353 [Sphingomonas gellani]|uniref:Uncharacterized protein n=1 Tax=Sphingomonas gellani TaxID=1166340 RepID=A0A1H8IM35_9SPHN|nr:hypothetical protein [Sphingomonas gellani]SEN70000.1 hypothetical protein SAMN05192583_3353 [Sphingomonas gellani]